jgi:opacity protein-like surface antigen
MTRTLAGLLALAMAVLAGGPAFANGRNVPAPIPVPAPVPVPESFTYYLRGDLGWAFVGDLSFSESGAQYGASSLSYSALSNHSSSIDDVFFGGIGAGAYISKHFRADITLELRGTQGVEATATYLDAGPIAGSVRESVKVGSTIGLINGYWDLWQRGGITPYLGAGVGISYNQIRRNHLTTEDDGTPPIATALTGESSKSDIGLTGALMAGITLANDHRWALDISYRALYLDGISITTNLTGTGGGASRADIDSRWEHQFRIGVRANIW